MSTAISTAELAAMQAEINNLLPDTCNILAPSSIPDGQGWLTVTWGTAVAGVACRLDPRNNYQNAEMLTGGAVQPYTSWILTLPARTVITTNSRVQKDGVIYAVTSVDTGKSWSAGVRASLETIP